ARRAAADPFDLSHVGDTREDAPRGVRLTLMIGTAHAHHAGDRPRWHGGEGARIELRDAVGHHLHRGSPDSRPTLRGLAPGYPRHHIHAASDVALGRAVRE